MSSVVNCLATFSMLLRNEAFGIQQRLVAKLKLWHYLTLFEPKQFFMLRSSFKGMEPSFHSVFPGAFIQLLLLGNSRLFAAFFTHWRQMLSDDLICSSSKNPSMSSKSKRELFSAKSHLVWTASSPQISN